MILNCVMILHSLLSWILGMKYSRFVGSAQEVVAYVPKKKVKKPPNPKKSNKKIKTPKKRTLKETYNPFKKMTRLIFLAALSKYHALPQLHSKSHVQMRNDLKRYRSFNIPSIS